MRIIGVTGLSRSGKDTIATHIVEKYNYKRMAFADSLKAACALLLNRPLIDMYEGDRESIMPEWGFSIREFLQDQGTRALREFPQDGNINKAIGDKFHIIRTFMEIGNISKTNQYNGVVISDLRFENEAGFVRGSGGIIIKVERDGLKKMSHVSEAGITLTESDFIVQNNSSLEDLFTKVDGILRVENIQ